MKKITLLLFATVILHNASFGQAILFTTAPQAVTTTQIRAPNGTTAHAFLRACSLVLASELTGISNGSSISSFGFTLQTGTSPLAVTGNFTVYLQNTSDVTYQKTTSWATILTGMTSVYANTMTVPNSPGTTSIVVTLSTPFVYTGGGIYVAYDWESTSTNNPQATAANFATYFAEGTALAPGGCSSAANITSPAATLGTTAFRPSFLFGVNNPYANDLRITGVEAPGKIAGTLNAPHTVAAVVKNTGYNTQSNISVSVTVTGANAFTNSQVIPLLPPGASTLVTFAAFNPLNNGANNIVVSVPSDDNNMNNTGAYPQIVSCNVWAQNPATAAGTYTDGPVGFGSASGIVATPFLGVSNSTLSGLRAAIGTDPNSVGKSVYGVLLSAAGAVLATTNTLVITNAMLTSFQQVNFATPQTLTSGTNYYLGFAQMANLTAYYPAGTLIWPYIKPNTYFSTTINGGVFTPLATSFGYFGIEGVFVPTYTLSAASQTVVCGTPGQLTTTGTAVSYSWNTGPTTSSIVVTPTSTTVYSVTATDVSGCVALRTPTLTVNPLPVLASSNSNTLCSGQSVNLTATGAPFFIWATFNGTFSASNSVSVSPQSNTTYFLVGYNFAGCTATSAVNIGVAPVPTVAISSSTLTVCQGGSVTFTATGTDNYLWSGGPATAINVVTPANSGSYAVTGTDNLTGCSDTKSISVTVNQLPPVSINASTVACLDAAITLTASGANTYTWTGSAVNATNANVTALTINPAIAGPFVYSVTGTGQNGCNNTAAHTFIAEACLGVTDNGINGIALSVYPNPGTGLFTLSYTGNTDVISLDIFNAIGSRIKHMDVRSENTVIDLQTEANGVYFIHVLNGTKGGQTYKLIKQ